MSIKMKMTKEGLTNEYRALTQQLAKVSAEVSQGIQNREQIRGMMTLLEVQIGSFDEPEEKPGVPAETTESPVVAAEKTAEETDEDKARRIHNAPAEATVRRPRAVPNKKAV